jgi:transcriptional regulator with XRE-family HTH domain
MTRADIVAIRRATGLSQVAFAKAYHLSHRTVEGWERGSRKLDLAALALLTMIGRDHRAVAALLDDAASLISAASHLTLAAGDSSVSPAIAQ